MCALDSTIYVFGGKDRFGRRNDLSTFDTRTNRWNIASAGSTPVLPATGSTPRESSFTACTAIGGSIMVGPGVVGHVCFLLLLFFCVFLCFFLCFFFWGGGMFGAKQQHCTQNGIMWPGSLLSVPCRLALLSFWSFFPFVYLSLVVRLSLSLSLSSCYLYHTSVHFRLSNPLI